MKYPLVSESNVQYKQYTHELFTETFTGEFGVGVEGYLIVLKCTCFERGLCPCSVIYYFKSFDLNSHPPPKSHKAYVTFIEHIIRFPNLPSNIYMYM